MFLISFFYFSFLSKDSIVSDADPSELIVTFSKKTKGVSSPLLSRSPSPPGMGVTQLNSKAFFHVTGMSCSSCVGKIEREIGKKKGNTNFIGGVEKPDFFEDKEKKFVLKTARLLIRMTEC